MANFVPDEAEVFVVSNSQAADADEMRIRLAGMPNVSSTFLPLGRPAEALANKSLLSKALAYGPSVASLIKVAAFIRRNRIQIIHSTDRPRDASYVNLLGHMTGAVSIVHMHSHLGDYHTLPTLWGMRNATAIFAISDYIRDGLVRMGLKLEKIHTTYNAVDTDHFDPQKELESRQSIRRQFGIPEKAPLVGIAARMNPWKGQIELIEAASLLRQSHADLHVIILGSNVPEVRADFEKRAREGGVADRIHFGGFQNDVRPFLQEFDLFVHPSYGEPFGLAITEAMAMRKPVIACGTGGVPEIITHGKDGWLVEERSAKAVAAAITKLLNDPELCRQMGYNARETVRTRFSPRQQCAAVAQQYKSLVAEARRKPVGYISSLLRTDGGPRC
ncbi:glycosyltransferase family 4 protein [Hyphomicrobium sp.]|uniref:glycosyltransferase family 4 protein n=1 Tax=Hyphomicrobium sp. TaxID=82 RepID=UPI00356A4A19